MLAIDDFIFGDKGIDPSTITKESAHLSFGVDRRAGRHGSMFFGTSAQPASWQTNITCPNQQVREALMAVLTALGDQQVRLLADLEVEGVVGQQLVTIDAAVSNVQWPGSGWVLKVTFDSDNSFWSGQTVETVGKTFADPLDQVIHLPAPGNVPTQPTLRILPTVQRDVPTPAVGWSKRQRFAVANTSDEPWFRYPVLIPLGDTTGLVSDGKAQASGADLRVWLHGLEQARTLVSWNTTASYVWVIVPALPAGEALTYEIAYGNPAATAADGVDLAYPELPAFDVLASTNYWHRYRSERDIANAALGLWPLSSALEGGAADFGVPCAWAPALTFENPNNGDSYVQPRAQRLRDGGAEWYQAMLYASRWQGPGFNSVEAYAGSDPYDGVVIHNPMGIRAVACEGIRWRNDAALKTTVTTTVGNVSETSEVLVPHDPYTRVVVIGRNAGGEGWHVLTEYGQAAGAGAESRLYLPSSGAAPSSPAFASDWGDTESADRVAAVAVKGATEMASKTVAATFATTFGSSGSGDNQFSNPGQVALDSSGNVYVADTANSRVKQHTSGGAYVSQITDLSLGAVGVCCDASGNVYVAGFGTLRKYNSAGIQQWAWSFSFSVFRRHLCTDGTTLYIAASTQAQGSVIQRVACADGSQIGYWGSTGSGNGQFLNPTGIAHDDTYLYVADTGNARVQKLLKSDGSYVTQWGTSGTGDGQFLTPVGVAVNPITGNILVTDSGRDDIQEFTNTGTFVRTISGPGSGSGQLSDPAGIVVTADGEQAYVADAGNNRIAIFDLDWDFSGQDILLRQYVWPLAAGVQFSTADTVKGQVRAATGTDVNARAQLVIRVISGDGTVRATLLGSDGAAMDNAFATSLTNREFPRDAPLTLEASYTTVPGDYLVMEIGARLGDHPATTVPGATLRFGDAAGDDLPEDETETGDLCPWVEFSTELFPANDSGIHTVAETWRPPRPVKHFGIACWPKGGMQIPENAESRVLVESDGDITVHIAAEPLVITQIEGETEIYELATELRLHGGGNAVGPYDTLLIGNARGLAGPGTPRAAVALGEQGLQIDTGAHTHTLWDPTYTTQVEALPAHAVRALVGVLRDIDAADIPALTRIPVAIPNGTFDTDLTGWGLEVDDAGWSYTVTHDPGVGGSAAGSLRFTLATTDPGLVLYHATTYVPVEPGDSVEVTAWVRQTDSGATSPRLGVIWYDADEVALAGQLNAAADIPLHPATAHGLTFAGAPPAEATQCRVVLGVTAVADAPGSKWFDDVAAAIIRPLRYDGSRAKVTEEARSSRWLPLAPPRREVPNGAFDADISAWALQSAGGGITQAASHDAAAGGDADGSLKVTISANAGSGQVSYHTDDFFAVSGAERVEVSAWLRSSSADIWPLLGILWYGDADNTLLATSLESRWAEPPTPNQGYRRAFAAIVPPGMTRFRLVIVADAVDAATGDIWADDVRLNDNALLVADHAIGEIEVTAIVRPRWTP